MWPADGDSSTVAPSVWAEGDGSADGVAEQKDLDVRERGGRKEVVLQNLPRYAALYLELA